MMRVVCLALLLGLCAPVAVGQSPVPAPWKQQAKQLAPQSGLESNTVQVLAPAGDSLWIGPGLTLYREAAGDLLGADAPALENNVVFALAAQNGTPRGDQVWAGLAFDTGGGEAGAGGFLVSTDGGNDFTRLDDQLDAPDDTTIAFGQGAVSAVPVTQQAGSSPQDLAFGPRGDTVWVAGARSGIRWTADGGDTWTRAVLPSDTSRVTDPATPTDLLVAPPLPGGGGWLNHLGYSVLVDETGTVWAGTAGGLNWSGPADGATVNGTRYRGWQRVPANDSVRTGPTGNFVVALAEQPRLGGRNPIWVASWALGQQPGQRPQRFGVAVTPDGGQRFRQTLVGERIYDVAARQARVYAVGSTGLFVSADQGRTWRSVERFPLRDEEQVLPSTLQARSVAVTDAALWVGTTDGLLRLDRSQEPALLSGAPEWQLFRARAPVNPGPDEEAPDVATYAYPNPFVPSRDQLVRIVYERDQAGTVEINIYDFGMNHVRTITEQKPAGEQETVWRGSDDQGLRVPTGTYFYTVDLGDRTVDGKILLAN